MPRLNRNDMLLLLALGLVVVVLSACQQAAEPTATVTPEAAAPNTLPAVQPSVVLPTAPPTVEPTATPTVSATVAATPTLTATVTATPTAPAATLPTLYTVQAGDSFLGIAEQFGVGLDALLYANGFLSLDEATLFAGQEVQIPTCGAYRVAADNTLFGIAGLCNVGLDELIIANIAAVAPLGSVDAVPIGFVLIIPESNPNLAPDCAEQPARSQVIEYTPLEGEGPFCLSQKFAISTATIIQANTQRLTGANVYGETPLLIAPSNGAIVIISENDVENGVTVADIADWYEVPVDSFMDFSGNPVSDPLSEGQQLFISGANLAFGPFQSQAPEPTATAEATATPPP